MLPRRHKTSVLSFDMDGCIFNTTFISDAREQENSLSEMDNTHERVIRINEKFLAGIAEELTAQHVDQAIVMLGSNRQSFMVDAVNSKNYKPSCFPILEVLRSDIEKRTSISCKTDKFLLADAYANKPAGYSFDLALQGLVIDGKIFRHPEWVFDFSKLSILYAQIHKIASENRESDITYQFYDDRDDILNPLNEFFTKHSDLIPKNVVLALNLYNGEIFNPINTIQGSGSIDNNYQNNTVNMVKKHCGSTSTSVNVIDRLDVMSFKKDCKLSSGICSAASFWGKTNFQKIASVSAVALAGTAITVFALTRG